MVAYPKNWKETPLECIFHVTRGQVLSTEKTRKTKSSGFKYPVYSSQTANDGVLGYYNDYLFENAITWTTDGANAGDTNYRSGKFYCTNVCGVLLSDEGYANRCMAAIINSVSKRYVSYVGNPKLMNNVVKKIKVFVPPLQEQQAISDTLSTFDEHIESLSKLIEKKKAIRDGALEDLVTGKTRLDGFEDGWEICRIETLTKQIITGGTPSTSEDKYWGGAIPWLSSTEIHQKRIMNPTSYITESGLKNSSAKMAPPCSVIVALAGQGKTRGTVAVLEREMALNQSLAAMVANDNTDFMFLYYALENGYEDLRELSSGDGGRGGLNKKILRDFEVKVPPCKDEQQAIASILTAMDEEINSLEQEKNKIAQLKEGAMDDLLTGRVRLV